MLYGPTWRFNEVDHVTLDREFLDDMQNLSFLKDGVNDGTMGGGELGGTFSLGLTL